MKEISSDFKILDLLSNSSSSDNSIPTLNGKEAEAFIDGVCSDSSREYIVKIHGIRPLPKKLLQKIFNKSPELLLSFPNGVIPSHQLISKIINNNSLENSIPVIHLFSCFSGAAQAHLNKVSGDVILCTYSHPNKAIIGEFVDNFQRLRVASDNLTKYILDNFYLCMAVDFAISVKLGNKLFSYKMDSDLFSTTENLQKLTAELEAEKEKFYHFHYDVLEDLIKKTLEKPTKVIPLDIDGFKKDQLTVGINIALVVAVANDHPIDNIRTLLNKAKIVPGMAFDIALEKNLEALKLFLEFDKDQVTEYQLLNALKINFDAVAMLLEHNASAISDRTLQEAIKLNKPDELQLLLRYAKEEGKAVDFSALRHLTTDNELLNSLNIHDHPLQGQLTQAVAGAGALLDSVTTDPHRDGYQQANHPLSPATNN